MGQRRKATQHLNLELVTLVDDEESFKDAAPMLFGKTFDQRAKDHINAVRSLKKPCLFHNVQKMQVMPYSCFSWYLNSVNFVDVDRL